VAEETGAYLIEELMSEVLSDPQLKYDYIHPNAAGYRRIAMRSAGHLRRAGALGRKQQ
jgi:lysophospholipase L1-like esterase